jgi:hypothetical protein
MYHCSTALPLHSAEHFAGFSPCHLYIAMAKQLGLSAANTIC